MNKLSVKAIILGVLIGGLSGCVMEPPYVPTDPTVILVRVCKDELSATAKQKEGDDAEVNVGFKVTCEWKEVKKNQQNNGTILSFGNNFYLQWLLLNDWLNGESPWIIPYKSFAKTSTTKSGVSIKFSGENFSTLVSDGYAKVQYFNGGAVVKTSSIPFKVEQGELYFLDSNLQTEILAQVERLNKFSVSVDISNVPLKVINSSHGKVVSVTTAIVDGESSLKAASSSFVTIKRTRGNQCPYYCDEP